MIFLKNIVFFLYKLINKLGVFKMNPVFRSLSMVATHFSRGPHLPPVKPVQCLSSLFSMSTQSKNLLDPQKVRTYASSAVKSPRFNLTDIFYGDFKYDWKVDNESKEDKIPFPGAGAQFVWTSGHWTYYNSSIVKFLKFKSITKDSLFTEVQILGYKSGDVLIKVHFREVDKKIAGKYLAESGVLIKNLDVNFGYYISNLYDTKLLFDILVKHNEFPADKLSLIRSIVGDSDHVKPVDKSEIEGEVPFSGVRRKYWTSSFGWTEL